MNEYRTHTDNDDDDLMLAERPVVRRSHEPQQEERDRGLVIARVIHHIGGGIRWSYNRNLAWAFVIALGLHMVVIGLYALSTLGGDAVVAPRSLPPLASLDSLLMDTNAIRIDMTPIVIVNPGGGGGDVTVKKPVGESKAGDQNAKPMFVPEKPKSPADAKVFDPKVPTKIKPVDKVKDDKRPLATTDKDTARGLSSGVGHKGQHADGKGRNDAGGSGGTGVGNGQGNGRGDGSGLASRGWLRAPSSKPFENMVAEGKVTLRFTVLPNGEITNISPIKTAHPSLLRVATDRLRAAKVRPLPAGSPPKSITSQYTFNFKMPH
jgi:outer membrane biosynthesis protein TonB